MLDAVLPLVRKDLERFRILERSIAVHLLPLQTCWVVVPDREYRELAKAIPGRRFAVVPESHIVPELAAARGVKGWYKQQLIKLAMAEHVETDYYLIFDADVICARPITKGDLFTGGKANCHRYPSTIHTQWYRWAERVLGVRRSGWVHSVTPTILSRTAVLDLAAYISSLPPRPGEWWRRLMLACRQVAGLIGKQRLHGPRLDSAAGRWRQVLLDSLPWTEYGLYFTYLEATGQFDDYHAHSSESLCGECVWNRANFADWKPTASKLQRPFMVVQSNTHIPPDLVLERVDRLLAG